MGLKDLDIRTGVRGVYFHAINKNALSAILMCLTVIGCEEQQYDSEDVIYSNISGALTSFDLNKKYFAGGDMIGTTEDCSSLDFPKCIIFDSTIILIPKSKVFDEVEEAY